MFFVLVMLSRWKFVLLSVFILVSWLSWCCWIFVCLVRMV